MHIHSHIKQIFITNITFNSLLFTFTLYSNIIRMSTGMKWIVITIKKSGFLSSATNLRHVNWSKPLLILICIVVGYRPYNDYKYEQRVNFTKRNINLYNGNVLLNKNMISQHYIIYIIIHIIIYIIYIYIS